MGLVVMYMIIIYFFYRGPGEGQSGWIYLSLNFLSQDTQTHTHMDAEVVHARNVQAFKVKLDNSRYGDKTL